MNVTVYTSVFGDYDTLQDLRPAPKGYKLLVVSDREHEGWESIVVEPPMGKNKIGLIKSNRYYKLQPWLVDPECDINVYIDGCTSSIDWERLQEKCEKLWASTYAATFVKHPRRGGRTIPEIYEIARQKKASLTEMLDQFQEYRDEGFKDDVHIIAAGFQVRKTKNKGLNAMLEQWWDEVREGCHRDQIAFSYSCWKSEFTNYDLICREERKLITTGIAHSKNYTINGNGIVR